MTERTEFLGSNHPASIVTTMLPIIILLQFFVQCRLRKSCLDYVCQSSSASRDYVSCFALMAEEVWTGKKNLYAHLKVWLWLVLSSPKTLQRKAICIWLLPVPWIDLAKKLPTVLQICLTIIFSSLSAITVINKLAFSIFSIKKYIYIYICGISIK